MKLSEQVKLLERENERLRNLADNLTEQLEQQQEYIAIADYYIDLTAQRDGWERYVGNYFDLAPDRVQEIVRTYRKLRREEEKPVETP